MTAAKLFREMMDRAHAAGRLSEIILYGSLHAITDDAFYLLPAGVVIGLFETLAKNETTAPRARAALALCASLKIAPMDVETFLFFGAGLWNMAARMVLDAVKKENDASTRRLLIEIVDGLLQDSSAMLVDFVSVDPTRAVQDVVMAETAEIAVSQVNQEAVRAARLALADAIDGFLRVCEEAPGCGASQVVFFDRIAPAFDDLTRVDDPENIPSIVAEREQFKNMPLTELVMLARKYRALASP